MKIKTILTLTLYLVVLCACQSKEEKIQKLIATKFENNSAIKDYKPIKTTISESYSPIYSDQEILSLADEIVRLREENQKLTEQYVLLSKKANVIGFGIHDYELGITGLVGPDKPYHPEIYATLKQKEKNDKMIEVYHNWITGLIEIRKKQPSKNYEVVHEYEYTDGSGITQSGKGYFIVNKDMDTILFYGDYNNPSYANAVDYIKWF